jgi:hypothetical protein
LPQFDLRGIAGHKWQAATAGSVLSGFVDGSIEDEGRFRDNRRPSRDDEASLVASGCIDRLD